MRLSGKVSWFGGPEDHGVAPDEGLAFIYEVADAPHLFLPQQPPGTTGLARRLDPEMHYIACRWDYDVYPKPSLLQHKALVRSPKTGRQFEAYPADWGPSVENEVYRIADISPGLMAALGIATDDIVEVIYPYGEQETGMRYAKIALSSGHGLHVPGASGLLEESEETVRISDSVATALRARGVTVYGAFHDTQSTTVDANLDAIINWHNSQPPHDLDVSIHFNSSSPTSDPRGTECLWVTQEELAADVSAAIAAGSGLKDRGAVYRDGLAFLNGTQEKSILIEVLFVDSETDVEIYQTRYNDIVGAIADVLSGVDAPSVPPPEEEPAVHVSITVPDGVDLRLTVNGDEVL